MLGERIHVSPFVPVHGAAKVADVHRLVLHVLQLPQVEAVATPDAPVEGEARRDTSVHSKHDPIGGYPTVVECVAEEEPEPLVLRQLYDVETLPGHRPGHIDGPGETS